MDPSVDTSFLPDKDREREMARYFKLAKVFYYISILGRSSSWRMNGTLSRRKRSTRRLR